MYTISIIGVDIFGILSKSGGAKKIFISLSHYSYDLIINIHYTLEKLDLILALVINIIHKKNSLIYKNCRDLFELFELFINSGISQLQ